MLVSAVRDSLKKLPFCRFNLCVLLGLLTICLTSEAQRTMQASVATGKPVPASFFGLHIHFYGDTYPWPSVPFGAYRNWDNGTRWSQTNTSPGVFNWTRLDYWLAQLKKRNPGSSVGFTMGSTPNWASSNKTDGQCDEGTGACDLPADLNADGSGTNATWKAWVTALAKHVNDPVYLQAHHKINWYEPWNEWYRNDRVLPGTKFASISVRATYPQMVRMTEDARCIITGKGSIGGVPCTLTAIDPNAQIATPSTSGHWALGRQVMLNFLYCNAPLPAGVICTTGNRCSAAVDIINSHFYEILGNGSQPENIGSDVVAYKAMLSSTDRAKPLFSDENAMGQQDMGGSTGTNEDSQAAFLARLILTAAGAGMDQTYWYAWNGLFPRALNPNGVVTQAVTAYGVLYNWLVGATYSAPCSVAGTVWTCNLTSPTGVQEQAIWDSSKTCSGGTCSVSQINIGSGFTRYQTLAGNAVSIVNGAAPVGIKPILLLP